MLFEEINVPVFEPNPLVIVGINQIVPIIIKQVPLMINIISKFAYNNFLSKFFFSINKLKLLYIFKYSWLIKITCHRR